MIGYRLGMRVIDLHLAARPESVPHARHALDDLAGLASPASLEDARLLVSELVTNSIRHGNLSTAQDIWLRADLEGDTLHVEVRDPGGGFAAPAQDRGEGGARLGVGALPRRPPRRALGGRRDGSTLVWFDMPLRRDADDPPT